MGLPCLFWVLCLQNACGFSKFFGTNENDELWDVDIGWTGVGVGWGVKGCILPASAKPAAIPCLFSEPAKLFVP